MTLLGLDANILLRALLNDHPDQSAKARRMLAGLDADRCAYVGLSALLETFWVLNSRYHVPRRGLCVAIRQLLMTQHLEIEGADAVARALSRYEKGGVDFQDALLAARNIEAGCRVTLTFDRNASTKVPDMELLA